MDRWEAVTEKTGKIEELQPHYVNYGDETVGEVMICKLDGEEHRLWLDTTDDKSLDHFDVLLESLVNRSRVYITYAPKDEREHGDYLGNLVYAASKAPGSRMPRPKVQTTNGIVTKIQVEREHEPDATAMIVGIAPENDPSSRQNILYKLENTVAAREAQKKLLEFADRNDACSVRITYQEQLVQVRVETT